jgi:hypothetical protein
MEHFAGLDVSMAETHVCVMNRDGAVAHEVKVPSTPGDIVAALAQALAALDDLPWRMRRSPPKVPLHLV